MRRYVHTLALLAVGAREAKGDEQCSKINFGKLPVEHDCTSMPCSDTALSRVTEADPVTAL